MVTVGEPRDTAAAEERGDTAIALEPENTEAVEKLGGTAAVVRPGDAATVETVQDHMYQE
jgi:hypothetical protein